MRSLPAFALMLALLLGSVSPVMAALPPPPPPPPGCKACSGPPPPPTPVPTLAPTSVAPQAVVDIKLEVDKVARGHAVRLSIDASTDDAVTVIVRYHKGKSTTYRVKVGPDGTAAPTWKVPKSAPTGKGSIQVTVQGAIDRYAKSFVFTVTR